MIKKIILITVILTLMAGAAAVYCFGRSGVRFDGDRVRNTDPERFYMRFDVLNADEEEIVPLREGDILKTSWQIDRGSIDLSIAMEGEAAVYQADGRGKGDSASFELTIPRAGNYIIRIKGKNAKGWIEFVQEPANN